MYCCSPFLLYPQLTQRSPAIAVCIVKHQYSACRDHSPWSHSSHAVTRTLNFPTGAECSWSSFYPNLCQLLQSSITFTAYCICKFPTGNHVSEGECSVLLNGHCSGPLELVQINDSILNGHTIVSIIIINNYCSVQLLTLLNVKTSVQVVVYSPYRLRVKKLGILPSFIPKAVRVIIKDQYIKSFRYKDRKRFRVDCNYFPSRYETWCSQWDWKAESNAGQQPVD